MKKIIFLSVFVGFFCGGNIPSAAADVRPAGETAVDCEELKKECLLQLVELSAYKAKMEQEWWRGVEEGNTAALEVLLRLGADVNQISKETGFTSLMTAVSFENKDLTKFLLSAGADVNLPGPDSVTPLLAATALNAEDLVKLLVSSGADVNQADQRGLTALILFAGRGNAPVVGFLLSSGAKINQATNNGSTALMAGVQSGKPEVVEMLLKKGADVNQKRTNGDTALRIAEKEDSREIILLLKKYGAKK